MELATHLRLLRAQYLLSSSSARASRIPLAPRRQAAPRRRALCSPALAMARCLDAAVHVWASPEEAEGDFPYAEGQADPPVPGDTTLLVKEMAAAGVDGTLIVQPINHKFDHSYVERAMSLHPGKFAGCLLADPTRADAAEEIEALAKRGFRAVRFNPYLWPEGEGMTNPVGRAMYAKCGELGLPVGYMCFKGLPLHYDDIVALLEEYPKTQVLLDHFGFCQGTGGAGWPELLALAKYPQVHVKLSAWFRVSSAKYPAVTQDVQPMVRELVEAFGAGRLCWGTDFPFVTEHCTYTQARELADGLELSGEEREMIMGGTLEKLLPGAWGE